jgi:hypothetical protein
MAGLAPDARVAVAGEPSGLLEVLTDDGSPDSAAKSVTSAAERVALGRLAADLGPFVDSVMPLLDHERALCAVPFGIVVR